MRRREWVYTEWDRLRGIFHSAFLDVKGQVDQVDSWPANARRPVGDVSQTLPEREVEFLAHGAYAETNRRIDRTWEIEMSRANAVQVGGDIERCTDIQLDRALYITNHEESRIEWFAAMW